MAIDYTELIKLTPGGLKIADYPEIRTAITNQFKEIYGSDIDLSTASADGIYVETFCLIINNILQGMMEMYANMNPSTASGMYLDIIAALTNVTRKAATKSSVFVSISNNKAGATDLTFDSNNPLVLVDQAGTTWTCEPFTIAANVENQPVLATCDTFGPVKADAGWITGPATISPSTQALTITQSTAASIGSYRESDADLRARRNDSLASRSVSVLQGLTSSLLNVTGLQDVKIYNNNTGNTMIAKDGTSIASHDVYVVCQYAQNASIKDSTIGNIIYLKMTPGVLTTATTETDSGDAHSYNVPNSLGVDQIVNWKVAKAMNPTITIRILRREFFATSGNSTANTIATSIIDYLNNLRLSTDLSMYDLQTQVTYADPLFKGLRTFSPYSVTIQNAADSTDNSTDKVYKNQDSFYYYTPSNVTISNDVKDADGNTIANMTEIVLAGNLE